MLASERAAGICAIAVLLGAAGLSACGGWHLRGSAAALQSGQSGVRALVLRTTDAPTIDAELRRTLAGGGVQLVPEADSADAILIVRNEAFERRSATVEGATGKQREVELTLRVEFQLLAPDGRELIAPEPWQQAREYIFDESAVLGTMEQDSRERLSLVQNAARALMLRVSALDLSAR